MSPPLIVIVIALVAFFWLVTKAAREFVLRRRDADAREALADQANKLLTAVAATFAFFVGFAISASWGAVTAAQTAVEQQAATVHQMAWELNNIPDRAVSAALRDKLRVYADTVVGEDARELRKGNLAVLPSAQPLDRFENDLLAYALGPTAPERQASTLLSSASALNNASATVSAVANRSLPNPLLTLLIIVGMLASILMGISTVSYDRPSLMFLWCLIPAVSIATVLALAYPFAIRSGVTLAPMQAVTQQLAAPSPSG